MTEAIVVTEVRTGRDLRRFLGGLRPEQWRQDSLCAGWSVRDLVAHVVGWMEQTVREIQTKEFTTGWTSETIQEYNDRSVRTHELVGAEAMVDELDTAYRRLVETVRGLPPGDVEEKIAGTLPYYTYLHWEEHFAELGIPL